MRRVLTIATFLLLFASAADAQSRSHGGSFSGRSFGGRSFSHGGHFGGRSFGGRGFSHGGHFGSRVVVGGHFGSGHSNFGVFVGSGGFRRPVFFSHGFSHRRFHSGFAFGFGFYGAPYYGYYPYYPYYSYDPYYAYPGYAYPGYAYPGPSPAYPIAYQTSPAYDRGDDGLASVVDRLRDEVDRLRQDRYDRDRVPQPPPRTEAKPIQEQTFVLVFRNGKREETSNYAVAGQTLWIFSEQRARKVPLSDLDVEATRAVNEDRGVEFNAGRR